jgi:hypothetical protein
VQAVQRPGTDDRQDRVAGLLGDVTTQVVLADLLIAGLLRPPA